MKRQSKFTKESSKNALLNPKLPKERKKWKRIQKLAKRRKKILSLNYPLQKDYTFREKHRLTKQTKLKKITSLKDKAMSAHFSQKDLLLTSKRRRV